MLRNVAICELFLILQRYDAYMRYEAVYEACGILDHARMLGIYDRMSQLTTLLRLK